MKLGQAIRVSYYRLEIKWNKLKPSVRKSIIRAIIIGAIFIYFLNSIMRITRIDYVMDMYGLEHGEITKSEHTKGSYYVYNSKYRVMDKEVREKMNKNLLIIPGVREITFLSGYSYESISDGMDEWYEFVDGAAEVGKIILGFIVVVFVIMLFTPGTGSTRSSGTNNSGSSGSSRSPYSTGSSSYSGSSYSSVNSDFDDMDDFDSVTYFDATDGTELYRESDGTFTNYDGHPFESIGHGLAMDQFTGEIHEISEWD